ncbi:hypothetical protein TIFTF001_009342 [Ficus carica]|uniref:Rho GTPase-activating protein REN1-like n=1 Tax=Ficus carica TaxID=3494 RepID=A0AA87ZUH1_FICCA|nr:hypothetical protein TIFTF001_009342 [Ficus carica]
MNFPFPMHGIGWTSWKKRWFILTRTSLVFFRSDPSAVPQKGGEVNLTLGGIDLNNSGSVVVKADKKLLTVLFPDGRDGRAFTLKAETLEDLQEWKTALENALAQAPSHATGQNGIFRNDQIDSVDGSLDYCVLTQVDRQPAKTSVIGRPILLALEDVDGTSSFLEKALQFIEEHGIKVEGILRQAADVDDVERRVREYEQGKTEFSPEEDAHIIGDCIKHVLRELPSSPVPASCCKALLQACRTERSMRVNAMRTAICETFPEPNRCLLQRILTMMQKVASHKVENRMSCSAVAACMAPLLLRPLLAGECEIENDFDVGGDGSAQLLQAAAAANHAQAIVITLLDDYDKIFGEGSIAPEPYSDTEESGSESEEVTDDDDSYDDDQSDDAMQDSDARTDDDPENASSATCSESGDSGDNSLCDDKDGSTSGPDSPKVGDDSKPKKKLSSSCLETSPPQPDVQSSKTELTQNGDSSGTPQEKNVSILVQVNDSAEVVRDVSSGTSSVQKSTGHGLPLCIQKSTTISSRPIHGVRNRSAWGRAHGRKNLSMESIDYSVEEDVEIQRLEVTKSELQSRIMEEVTKNAVLRTNMERRKEALQQRRLALEHDVARLQEQLQKERDLRAALGAGLSMSHVPLPNLATVDEKTRVQLEEIAEAEADVVNLTHKLGDLRMQLNQQCEPNHGPMPKPGILPFITRGHQTKLQVPFYFSWVAYLIVKDKLKDNEAIAPSQSGSSRNKDGRLGGSEKTVEVKLESASSSNKHLPQSYQSDPIEDTFAAQPAVPRRTNLALSKRSGTKSEGTINTTSALTKLTTRLNFLKERRSQIANELQNMDIGRGFSQTVQNLETGREFPQYADKNQGSEVQASQNPEKGRDADSGESFWNLDGGVGTEGQSFQYPEKIRKVVSHSLNYADRGKRSDDQSIHGLDRGKSDSHLLPNVEKGRIVESQPFVAASRRTSSR